MIPRTYIALLKATLLFGLFFPIKTEAGEERSFPVDLSLFEGHKSFLLDWTYIDTIDAKTIIIKSKNTVNNEYRVIQNLLPNTSRYLINNCEIDLRYFFIIEIEDQFGNLYFSDSNVPVFGSCLLSADTNHFDPNISTVKELFLSEIKMQINNLENLNNIETIFSMLNSDSNVETIWLEEIPFNVLKNIDLEVLAIDDIMNNTVILDSLIGKESLYRNQIMLTPSEWREDINNTYSILIDRWKNLYTEYQKSLLFLSQMPPIHILGAKTLQDGQKEFVIQIVNDEKLNFDESYLLYMDEYLDLSSFENDSSGLISIYTPENWKYVDLMVNGIFHQRFPLWVSQPLTNTMEGDLVPSNDIYSKKVRVEPSTAWFNEMIWSPKSMKLDLEASGIPDFDDHYAFMIENQIIWELEWGQGFEIQFMDSSIILDQFRVDFPFLLSWNKWDDDHWEPIEYMILDSLPLAISRFPDGQSWDQLNYATLGSTNDPQFNEMGTELIPELFVLYQNYPNPFNGLTRLTFDLLEDAIVSLYVTDATGRVQDIFVENQFLIGGTYNYEWSGEKRSTGIYFFTIHAQTGNFASVAMTRKMIYLK